MEQSSRSGDGNEEKRRHYSRERDQKSKRTRESHDRYKDSNLESNRAHTLKRHRSRSRSPVSHTRNTNTERKTIGPERPPPTLLQQVGDEEFGPSTNYFAVDSIQTSAPIKTKSSNSDRGSWMTEPPKAQTSFDLYSSRRFRSQAVDTSFDSTWTETPAERQQRIATGGQTQPKPTHLSKPTFVKPTSSSVSKNSVLQQTRERLAQLKADATRSFDRERDFGDGRRHLSAKDKQSLLDNAKRGLPDRFSRSQYD